MRKLILFLLICQHSLGQITLTPNSVGMNSPAENNVLTAQGNGLVVQKKYTLTNVDPNSNVQNIQSCGSGSVTSNSLAGILKDPYGDNPYISNNHNCTQYFNNINQGPFNYLITFSVLDMGTGDSVIINSASGVMKFTGNSLPSAFFLEGYPFDEPVAPYGFTVKFVTNSDSFVGQGFALKYQAIPYTFNPSTIHANHLGGNSLVFDAITGSLTSGYTIKKDPPGIYSIGLGYYPINKGQHSVSIGYKNLAIVDNSVAIGSENTSDGWYSVTLGSNNRNSAANSLAIGKFNSVAHSYGTAIGLLNTVTSTAEYGAGIGTSNLVSGFRAIAFGNDLKSKSVDGVVIGNYNNEDDSPNPLFEGMSTNDRIFQIGNGGVLSRSNAITILRNGNMGLGNSPQVLSPDSRLVIDGFTRLGTDAPKVKMKEISGNMPALNANNTYSHGLTDAKILSITITAEVNNQFIPPNYTGNSSLEYNYYWTAGSLYILNKNGNSAGLTGVPFKALITYKE